MITGHYLALYPHGANGLVVKTNNIEAVAEAIKKLYTCLEKNWRQWAEKVLLWQRRPISI
jgi:glycosyltransferase involved in cell wall biosynthesis